MNDKLLLKYRNINSKLRKEEIKMCSVYLNLKENAETMLKNKIISDYECDITMKLFTSNLQMNKKYNVQQGDPFYESKTINRTLFEDVEFFNRNWSEDSLDINLCYTMHDLLYHSNLLEDEIEDIELVWFDVNFAYQFLVNRL